MYKFCVFSYAKNMKKSNKITAFYVISSISLCLVLLLGGAYGVYLSVGMNFMRSTVSNVTDVSDGVTQNVSLAENNAAQPSLTGVIILSAILIVISIFDMISLIRQLVFFKQFKLVRESGLEHFIEDRVKSKSSVVFFACVINVLSFIAGAVGIFINVTSFVNAGLSWILYVVDGLVVVLSVVSFVLLIKKVKMDKPSRHEINKNHNYKELSKEQAEKKLSSNSRFDFDTLKLKQRLERGFFDSNEIKDDIDSVEYVLLKLKSMKNSDIISTDEFEYLREKLTGMPRSKARRKREKEEDKLSE